MSSNHTISSNHVNSRSRPNGHTDVEVILPSIEGNEFTQLSQRNQRGIGVALPIDLGRQDETSHLPSSRPSSGALPNGVEVVDLTSPRTHRGVKRPRPVDPFSDRAPFDRHDGGARYVVNPFTNDRKYTQAMSSNLEQPVDYSHHPLSNPFGQRPIEQVQVASYGREPLYPTRPQPPVPIFCDLPPTKRVELPHHPDDVRPLAPDRMNNVVPAHSRSLPYEQSLRHVSPRRTSLVYAERLPAVMTMKRQDRPHRDDYTDSQGTSDGRQQVVELNKDRNSMFTDGPREITRVSNGAQLNRYYDFERQPQEVVEYLPREQGVKGYNPVDPYASSYRRVPHELGGMERLDLATYPVSSRIETSHPPTSTAHRRYALMVYCGTP